MVDIGADEISMSWSYGAEDARAALTEVRKYLPVFESFGYVAYDPQLERVFDPDRDSADAEQTHDYVRGRLTEAYGDPPRERRPWWKRLLG